MISIQPPKLKYSLVIDDVTYVLPHAPMEWEDEVKKWSRSPFYWGMSRSYSEEIKFVLDGAWLLRREYYTKNLRAEALLVIEELEAYNWQYRVGFTGAIDFSTFKDGEHDVTVRVMEQGITEMVKAYEDVEYEIPLNVPGSIQVRVPGVRLLENVSSIIEPENQQSRFEFYNIMGIDIVSNELDSMYVTAQSVEQNNNFGSNNFPTSENWHIRGEANTSISINVKLKGEYELSRADQSIQLMIVSSEGGPIGTVLYTHSPAFVGASTNGNGIDFDIEFNFSYEISAGEKLFLANRRSGPDGNKNDWLRVEEGSIQVANSLVTEDTIVRAMRPFDLYRELLYRMNQYQSVEAQSFILQGDNWKRLIITSGDAIRGIEDPKIRTTFKEFFQAINSLVGVGFGMESGKAVLEEKAYWMKGSLKAFSVGEVKNCVITPAVNYLFNTIKVGYKDQDYEQELGREEVNSSQQWTTPITRIQKSMDLISPYRADQLGIEELRTVPSEQNDKQVDKDSDNDTFMIKIQAEPGVDGIYDVEGAEHYRDPNGIFGFSPRESYYNLDITPKKNLLRHGNYLRSMLHRYESRIVRFESGKKNTRVRTVDLNGTDIQENISISISNLPAPIFLPYQAEIEFAVPKDAGIALDTKPTGYMEFEWLGVTLGGFFLDVGQGSSRNSEQTWKLLLTPNSNIEKLIR